MCRGRGATSGGCASDDEQARGARPAAVTSPAAMAGCARRPCLRAASRAHSACAHSHRTGVQSHQFFPPSSVETERTVRHDARGAVSAPAVMVVDRPGLDQLVAAVADEEYYAFDTEFHTERTYVPDLALIQIAWADKVALVDPLAVDPEPLATIFSGPGTAVAHAAFQDLDVLQAACGAVPTSVFDTQVVAGFLGMSTPSLSRLVDQVLGVTLPKADRLSDWLVRPISERQVTYAVSDVAHLLELRSVLTERLQALGRLEWALNECAEVLGDRTAPRVPEEAWWKLGDIRSMSRPTRSVAQEVAAWRERTAAESNRPRRMVLSDLGLLAISQRPPRTAGELRGIARGRRPPSCAGSSRRDPRRGRARPRNAVGTAPHAVRQPRCASAPGGRRSVLGPGPPGRRRPRLRPGSARHEGGHRAADLRRAEPSRHGVAARHRRRAVAATHRRRGGGRVRPPQPPRPGGALAPAGPGPRRGPRHGPVRAS